MIEQLADVNIFNNNEIFEQVKAEILKNTNGSIPTFWDPYCGGGSLPLEAMRLGLPAIASDINPVAVFTTKILIELAPKHAHHPAINPDKNLTLVVGNGSFYGLRKDVEYYSQRIFETLARDLGQYYPEVKLYSERVKYLLTNIYNKLILKELRKYQCLFLTRSEYIMKT